MLISDGLYIKKCRSCGAEFRTEREKVRICDLCKSESKKLKSQKENQAAKKPKEITFRPAADIELIPLVRIIDRYNEENGTSYTYGQFMQRVAERKIDLRKEAQNAGLSKKNK